MEQPKVKDAFDAVKDGWCCRTCGKTLSTKRGAAQHYTDKHFSARAIARGAESRRRDRQRERAEPSIAERMLEAQLQFAMGEPVDDDWLLDCL